MAKTHSQKSKILFLERMLLETGEDHVVSMQDILAMLLEQGIRAERKSIYDDMETLREVGMDIQFRRARPSGYYLAGNTLETIEVQKLPVQSTAEVVGEADFAEEETSVTPVWEPKTPEIVQDRKPLRLLCNKEREEEIRAYFGEYAEYKEKEPGYLAVTVPAMEDAQFYGWLTAMGKDVHIVKPKKAAAAYRDYLKILAKEYKRI